MAKPIGGGARSYEHQRVVNPQQVHEDVLQRKKGEHVMADKFTFGSAGEIQDVEFALARNGWTHALLKKATQGGFFGLVREVVEGRAEICRIERLVADGKTAVVVAEHLIDCDAAPFEPSGLTVARESEQLPNRVRGQFVFDPTKVKLHLSPDQRDGKYIKGKKLRRELAREPVLTANVLDYLLKNPHLIPEEWKGKAVFFWGTIYRVSDGDLYVRYLCFVDGRWYSDYDWLGGGWDGDYPAALRAS
ncbi:MAG: hypothetical protein WAP51_01140 [Candidatus Sungiibacteriota bacterium]